jgi:hypothetical protein
MGRRSTKSSPTTGAALPFDTVGMTILPGRSLPEWAEPAAAAPEFPGPELIADAPVAEVDEAYSQAAEPQATSQVPQEWAAVGTTPPAAPTHTVSAPEPAFAMAGAGLVGAAMAGAPAAAVPAGYGHLDQGYPPEPSRYPAAPAAGLAAMAPASAAAPGTAPASGQTAAPAYGQGWQASPPPVSTATGGAGPAMAAYGASTLPAPRTSEPPSTGGTATATAYAPEAPARTLTEPPVAHPSAPTAPPETHASEAPSSEWKSPERAELSPEHVALLSWWADMIAAGQFPAPAGTPTTEASPPEKKPRRSFPVKAAALGLIAVVAIGAAAVVGPKVMASSDPVVVPATELSLPSTVGDLVAITDPAVGTELETLLGFGLRPAGVTVTNAYGTGAEGPLAMAAMATTMGAPAEAVGQIATWAERTGATVSPSVAGTGANEGITCAAVEAIPDAQPGSFCVWSASGKRGQTYSVAMSVEDAQNLTNQLRSTVTGA